MTTEVLEQQENNADTGRQDLGQEDSDNSQYVTFIVGAEVFAVDMSPVQEIIRVPDTVRVPLAPHTLEGLANLRGKVLPIISLRRIFNFEEREYDDATRAVVIDLGQQPLGFVVDRVSSVVSVEPSQMENADSLSGTVDTELLNGILKDVGGHKMVMVMDFAKLIAREFADIAALSQNAKQDHFSSGAQHIQTGDDDATNDELQLVSFAVAGEEYAIAIEDVQEIVQMPEHIVQVPHSEHHVLGLMTLRNRLLPLVSLRRMFGLPNREADEHSRIVVVALGGTSVGVVMDSVNEVLRVAKTHVDMMPGLLARDDQLSDITDICRLEGGKRLVSIISASNMFRHSAIREALTTVSTMDAQSGQIVESDQDNEINEDEEQVVVFKLDKEEYGVPIESVQEIVRVPDQLTHVPKSPNFVEGVINLRGSVLPVIDQRRRLGLPSFERNDRQRIMVFLIAGVRTGFIVDSVTEVLKIRKAAIEKSPHLSGEQAKLIGRVANLEQQKRLIQLIEPSQLLGSTDLKSLADIGK